MQGGTSFKMVLKFYLETQVNEQVKRKEKTSLPNFILHKNEWHLHDCINKMSLLCRLYYIF